MADEEVRTCVFCGKTFSFTDVRQICCSKKCVNKRHYRRHREEYLYKARLYRDRDVQQRYIAHRDNADHRNIPFLLTFAEWWSIWETSGKWHHRGNRSGQYCMARYGDRGAYEIGNVRICLVEENHAERNHNYPMTDKAKALISVAKKGKPISAAHRLAISIGQMGHRMVIRDGRRTWAYPGDLDYPETP